MNRSLGLALGLGIVLALPAVVTAGCFLSREQACDVDGDCAQGNMCATGKCQPKPCKTNDECGKSTECEVHTCTNGTCETAYPMGPLPDDQQTPNDCLKRTCDGHGGIETAPDTSDVPADDGNPCTDEICSADGGAHPYSMPGAPCPLTMVDQGVCDGAGTCVQCVSSTSCMVGDHPRCVANQCVSCDNGQQDGDEQGVDCGGACPLQCVLGPCSTTTDCKSGLFCTGGLCRLANGTACSNDAECSSLRCVGTGAKTCQACSTNSQCASQQCVSGSCTAP